MGEAKERPEQIMESNTDAEEWRLEVERVAPQLKVRKGGGIAPQLKVNGRRGSGKSNFRPVRLLFIPQYIDGIGSRLQETHGL